MTPTTNTQRFKALPASYRWWRANLSWNFVSSQGTDYLSNLSWAAAALVRYRLQRAGYNVWKASAYGAVIAFGCLAIYKVYDVGWIYFVDPLASSTKQKSLSIEDVNNDVDVDVDADCNLLRGDGVKPSNNDDDDDAEDETDLFEYTALPKNVYTRLLLLYPAWSTDAELKGELIDFPYDTPIYFHALSYAWAAKNKNRHILLGRKKLRITSSCASALIKLRPRCKGMLLWVDAICIDQANIQEKSEQLGHMQNIYSSAADTFIWLNDESGSDEIALRYCRLFTAGRYFGIRIQKWWERKVRHMLSDRQHNYMFTKAVENSWMNRIWTVQEMALGKWNHTWVVCGSQHILLENIGWSLSTLATFNIIADTFTLDGMLSTVSLDLRLFARMGMSKGQGFDTSISMSHMLQRLQTQYATDPRDKIYGVLTFFDAVDIMLPSPSYAKSAPVIFWDAMVAICNHEQSLDLLTLCSGYREEDTISIPTWVPDFRTPATPRRLHIGNFKATSDSKPKFVMLPDVEYLMVNAHIIDVVQGVSNKTLWIPDKAASTIRDGLHINLEEGAQQSVEALLEWLYITIGQETSPYQDELEAFRELLLQGSQMPFTPRDNFSDWLKLLSSVSPSSQIRQDSSPDEIIELLCTHTKSVPELYDKYFNPESPLHHLTKDIYWSLMTVFKTNKTMSEIYHYVWSLNRDSKFFITQKGYIGTGTTRIRTGDVVALIAGLKSPMILRTVGDSDFYVVVGIAYVQGIMDGSYWDHLISQGTGEGERIILI